MWPGRHRKFTKNREILRRWAFMTWLCVLTTSSSYSFKLRSHLSQVEVVLSTHHDSLPPGHILRFTTPSSFQERM